MIVEQCCRCKVQGIRLWRAGKRICCATCKELYPGNCWTLIGPWRNLPISKPLPEHDPNALLEESARTRGTSCCRCGGPTLACDQELGLVVICKLLILRTEFGWEVLQVCNGCTIEVLVCDRVEYVSREQLRAVRPDRYAGCIENAHAARGTAHLREKRQK